LKEESVSEPGKETKAQRVERLKQEMNPWAAYAEIERFARDGVESIPAEWLGTYFRWWGIYTQGDGLGAIGGKGGEGRAVPYFMLRIRVPNGFLTSAQLRTIGDLADRYARGVADLTVRQNIQLHWVRVEDLPAIFRSLTACGLGSLGTCGDVTRNITGCPLAGLDGDEVCDASPLVHAATAMVNGSPEFYNLPRKYKVSITGCRVWCTYPEINDLGLTAVHDLYSGRIGYSVRVGGGLSTQPHLARRLDAFVRPEQVLAVVKGVSEIFRDSEGLRQNREKARLKFLFLEQGWTGERFLGELEARLGFRLDPGVPEALPEEAYRDHVGIHPQKQGGLIYAGLPILRGRLTADEAWRIAALAERYGTGELRTTSMQNVIVVNVPEARAEDLARATGRGGLRLAGSPFRRGTVACTGSEFCKLALTETKGFARWLVEDLEERLPGFEEHVRINITGCPNSCGQHWIADIGIEGKKVKIDGRLVDAYYFCVGGAVGKHAAVARPVGYRVAAAQVPEAMERLLRTYLGTRRVGQTFREFCAAHTDEELRTFLAGTEVAAAARDGSPGPVPHGLDA
jgi:sulfite reductase (ferredoxin)